MSETAAIDVDGVSVSFPLYHGNARSLKKTVISSVTGRMAADARNRVVVEALRGESEARHSALYVWRGQPVRHV